MGRGAGEGFPTPAPGHWAPTQPRPATFDRFEKEFPTHEGATVSRRNRQDEIARWLDRSDDEGIRRAGKRGHNVADSEMLQLRDDFRRARSSTIVDPIVAVPAGTAGTHLHEPTPHGVRRRCNTHGVHHSARRVADKAVSR